MSRLLCEILGHKLPKGYANGRPYLTIKTVLTDGIGRQHAFLYARCDRCDEEYHVASIHLPEGEEQK